MLESVHLLAHNVGFILSISFLKSGKNIKKKKKLAFLFIINYGYIAICFSQYISWILYSNVDQTFIKV